MQFKDPIAKTEEIVKEVNRKAETLSKPVLKRYPLLFSFLFVFSTAAILHGFELWSDQFEIFRIYPSSLVLIGIILLILTGTLYKALEKM